MSQRISIRTARSQDMVACAGILNAWIDETEWLPRVQTPEAIVRHYKTDVFGARRTFVATADGTVIGLMALSTDGYVSSLCLLGKYRGRGIGTLLMDQAKVELGNEVRLWTFEANTLARAFCRKQGFFEINRTDGDNEEGLPDVLLEWRAREAA